MPRGDFLGARNMGLPARSRTSPSAAAGVLDRGRCLHPTNLHPSKKRLSSSGTLASRSRPPSSASCYNISPLRTKSPGASENKSMQEEERYITHDEGTSGELSWAHDDSFQKRQEVARRAIRHQDTGTPLCYSPAFEAYNFHVKDRWCSASCLCLHHAAASDDAVLARAALEGLLPFTRKHGLSERDDAGRTPAMVAAWLSATAALQVLVAGSNLDLQDKHERTIFHCAAMSKNPGDVFAIICGKNCDMKIKDRFGDTCLHKMAGLGDAVACEMLCRSDPRLALVKNSKGQTAFEIARTKKVKDAVSLDKAHEIIKGWERDANKFAEELYEAEKKEAQKKKMEELEAMRAKKGASLAHGLGVSENIKKVTGDQRDDWDVFHPKAMSRQADSNKHVDKEMSSPFDDFDDHIDQEQEITFFSKIQNGKTP